MLAGYILRAYFFFLSLGKDHLFFITYLTLFLLVFIRKIVLVTRTVKKIGKRKVQGVQQL